MKVFVIGMTGKRLCPTSPSKAKKLLKAGKAHVYRRVPFTIRLDYKTGGSAPALKLGIDTGEQHIGTAVCNDATVFCKSEIELINPWKRRKGWKNAKYTAGPAGTGRPGTGIRNSVSGQSGSMWKAGTGNGKAGRWCSGIGRKSQTRS